MAADPSKTEAVVAAAIRKEAVTSAATNCLINALLNAWLLEGKGPHVLSVDSIASTGPTVLGAAVPLAVSIAFILSTITFHKVRRRAAGFGVPEATLSRRPYFFFGLANALGAAFFMFGAVVSVAVMWQRLFGSIEVTTPVAALVAGLVAAASAAYSCSRAARELLRP